MRHRPPRPSGQLRRRGNPAGRGKGSQASQLPPHRRSLPQHVPSVALESSPDNSDRPDRTSGRELGPAGAVLEEQDPETGTREAAALPSPYAPPRLPASATTPPEASAPPPTMPTSPATPPASGSTPWPTPAVDRAHPPSTGHVGARTPPGAQGQFFLKSPGPPILMSRILMKLAENTPPFGNYAEVPSWFTTQTDSNPKVLFMKIASLIPANMML
ncbi:Formin-like protein [Frankliniella fusca]|uniref:Formin-like protein n=1 Tax=Frankliniella fusca TaxID=407009 RepID=A0AAE1GY21_9NEOP|nr:Formin-like protein [Frankliniella fusca]